ncbi:MAG: xanthine phosphoribosyltransferase [Clostridia bacterium]|nr:xanthine phosphoribosyltransferase [Clostridia bacterium]
MQELSNAILRDGIGLGTDVVKVDSFLNHRIDTGLLTRMGEAVREAFADEQVDCVLTVEASGIALALTTAQAFGNVPVIFAKKSGHINVGSDVYSARVYSFTHQRENLITVSRRHLQKGMRVLIVDDFLANGEAMRGLTDILRQAECVTVGAAVAIEKGFQPGGQKLREEGLKVVALATVDAIRDGQIILREA